MASSTEPAGTHGITWFRWIRNAAVPVIVGAETLWMYLLLVSVPVPGGVVYAGTGVTAAVIAGSVLYVASRRVARDTPPQGDRKATVDRVAEVVTSITVVIPLAVFLGGIGGLGLTILARLGGPDPTTADGDPLRDRLLDWHKRNREFMSNNGKGSLPLAP